MKKILSVILSFLIVLSGFLPLFNHPAPLVPTVHADNSCQQSGLDVRGSLFSRVGGVALDQAATFLANMDDITGAYYDSTLDRIVFVGKKNTVLPEFNKDDLAVAIRAVVFNNQNPAVSMEFPAGNLDSPTLNVLYYGGIENTRFGKVLFDADDRLKSYVQGFEVDGNELFSSVPGFRSFFNLYLDKNPTDNQIKNYSRWWIVPKLISLKKDDTTSSFVFDQATMQVLTEPINSNDPKWNQAAQEFADHQTAHYDEFAVESPAYADAKQLGKIVSVVKWLKDNNITTDFNFARDYTPAIVPTPVTVPTRLSWERDRGGLKFRIAGGVTYNKDNTYGTDTAGQSSGLKAASQAIPTTKEDIHWTFTQNGQQYDSVAVTADAFRSLGSYSTSQTDMSFPATGDLNLGFQRTYSSFSGGQKGIGRGWDFVPARLIDNKQGWFVYCNPISHPWKLGLQTQNGLYETFYFANCTTGEYGSEKPEYHSKLIHNSNSTFTATLKDQSQYIFDSSLRLINFKDSHGNALSYGYDSSGKLTSITDPQNHQLILSYNAQGLLSSLSDWAGRSVKYGYDAQANLVSVADPAGGISKYVYNADNKLTQVVNRLSQIVLQNTYTPEAKIATQKDAAGVTTSFNYDLRNKTISASDNNGRIGKAVYDDRARILQANDALSNVLKYSYGTPEFAPTAVIDKKGNTTKFSYDSSGNQTSITYPNNKQVRFSYDGLNHLTQISDDRYLNNQTNPKITDFMYTSDNLLSAMIENNQRSIIYSYDATGQLSGFYDFRDSHTTYTRDSFGNVLTSKDDFGNTTTFVYDSLGRLIKQTDPSNKVTTFTYDANNNIISQVTASGTTAFTFDKENQLVKTTTPKGTTTNFGYNSSGALTGVTDAASGLTSYGYDAYQNLTSARDALSRVINSAYDKLDRQTSQTTPLGRVSKVEYDQNGNITKRTDALGRITTYTYDNLNRLIKTTYPDTSNVTRIYDNRGNLSSVTNGTGTIQFFYDIFDRLTTTVSPFNLPVYYAYDANDNLTKLTYPDGWFASYGYDANNRLISVTDYAGAKTTYSYFKNGDLSQRVLPNGITTNYGYDGSDRLVTLEHLKGITSLAKFVYQRDSLGNIVKMTESGSFIPSASVASTPSAASADDPLLDATQWVATVSAGIKSSQLASPSASLSPSAKPSPTPAGSVATPTPSAKPSASPLSWLLNWLIPVAHAQTTLPQYITTFSYDPLSRVTGATYPDSATYTYSYDKVGNRLNQVIKGVTTAYSYNNDNQLTKAGSTTYSYNLNGALAFKGNQEFHNNFENQMVSFKNPSTATISATYAYDGLGNRWSKTVNGTLTRYINDLSGELSRNLGELGTGPATLNYNLYGVGLISQGNYNYPSRQYILEDGQGNTRFLTDSSGNVIRTYNYDPYGNTRVATGNGSTKFKFDQQWVDTETNLYYLRARYYDPTTGSFTSKDPVSGILTDPTNQNGYNYANGNPVNLDDPSGQQVWRQVAIWCANKLGMAAPEEQIASIRISRLLGLEGEEAAGIVKNTQRIDSLTGTAKYRIPDQMLGYNLEEVKNVATQPYTNQIKDDLIYTHLTDEGSLILRTRPDTHITAPLQEVIDNGDIIHKFLK